MNTHKTHYKVQNPTLFKTQNHRSNHVITTGYVRKWLLLLIAKDCSSKSLLGYKSFQFSPKTNILVV